MHPVAERLELFHIDAGVFLISIGVLRIGLLQALAQIFHLSDAFGNAYPDVRVDVSVIVAVVLLMVVLLSGPALEQSQSLAGVDDRQVRQLFHHLVEETLPAPLITNTSAFSRFFISFVCSW